MYKMYSNKNGYIEKKQKQNTRYEYYENTLLTAFELSRNNYPFIQECPITMISNSK